jgi:hypothetical protein
MPMVIPSVYRHTQSTPATEWVVQHNLGGNGSQGVPMVEVLWDDGISLKKLVPAGIEMTDRNTVTIRFNSARTGQAIIVV